MQNFRILAPLLALAVALAGCAGDSEGTGGTTPTDTTPTTTTPTQTTPTSTTPTPVTPTPNGTDEPEPVACPEAPTTNASAATVMGYPQIEFTVGEPSANDPCFAFVGPESATAGWTAVTLNNTGMAMHIMPMFFAGNRSYEEISAAVELMYTPNMPDWLVPVGGVGVATPFQSGTALMNLQEGSYVIVCVIDGHHVQGMWRVLNVTAADEGEALPEPTANFTVTLENFNFTIPENVTAGYQVIKFVNNGTEPHEAPLLMVNEGHTFEELLAALENPTGPPPGAGIGGVNVLAPGATAYAIADLQSGTTYGFVCFVESPTHSGMPHVALGMSASFTVE